MFFSSLPPFVVGMLEKDLGEDEVMAAPEAYDIFKKNNVFTVANFFLWMGEAVYHSLVTWFIALGQFSVTDVGLKNGQTGGLWYHGDTVFAAGVLLVNIQMFINCRYSINTLASPLLFLSVRVTRTRFVRSFAHV
jgi:phospholipid-transporting ATPase